MKEKEKDKEKEKEKDKEKEKGKEKEKEKGKEKKDNNINKRDSGKNIYINNVKNRILSLSPTVDAGIERECTKDDFYSEGNKEIGKGGYSRVWKVSHKNTGKIYVIKLMNKQKIIRENIIEQINREVKIMYKVNHPHIIKLINHFEDDQNVYLIMELGAKGQLLSLLKKYSHGLDQPQAAQFMREIISAVKYLHSMNPPVIHRDIKPENILLDSNNRCKLADFGLSNYVYPSEERNSFCGTPQYLAPEMVEQKGHGPGVDIWALGVLLFELLTGKLPFKGYNPMDNSELFNNIKHVNIIWPGGDFNPLAKNLITKILKYDPKDRPSLDEILEQPWFENFPLNMPLLEIKECANNEEFLEQHTITLKKKEVVNDVKIQPQKKTINDVVKQIDSETNLENSSKKSNELEQKNSDKNAKDNEEKEKEKINDKTEELNKAMQEINSLNNIINNQKNVYAELRQKYDKSTLELNKLSNELSNKKEDQKKIDKLNSEIIKYKILDKERLTLLSDMENKNNTIVNLNSELKKKEDEIKQLQKVIEESKAELKKNKNIMSSLENKITELNQKLEEEKKNNEKALEEQNKKNKLFKQKILAESLGSENFNKYNFVQLIKESMNDLKESLDDKSIKVINLLNNIHTTMMDSIKQPSEFYEKMNNKLKDLTQSTEKCLEESNKNSIVIIENEIKSKLKLQFDWQNKQIDELMEYKIKAKNLETKISSLETQNKNLEDTYKIIEDENNTLNKLIKEKEEKIKEIEIKLLDTENFNACLKDFILRGKTIDEYEEFLEMHGK